MTSLNATHVSLYSVRRVKNFMFQSMLVLTEVTELSSQECAQRRFSDKQCQRQRWQLTVKIGRFLFFRENVRHRTSRL